MPRRTKAHKLLVQRRTKQYPRRLDANWVIWITKNGRRARVRVDDRGGSGVEIAKEITVCTACAAVFAPTT